MSADPRCRPRASSLLFLCLRRAKDVRSPGVRAPQPGEHALPAQRSRQEPGSGHGEPGEPPAQEPGPGHGEPGEPPAQDGARRPAAERCQPAAEPARRRQTGRDATSAKLSVLS